MRATTIHAPGDIRARGGARPRPSTAPTDAIVKVVAGCICGSDLWPYRGENDIDAGVDDRPRVRRRGRGGRQRGARLPRRATSSSCRSATATTPAPHCRAGVQSACLNLGFTASGQAEYARVTQADGQPGRRPTACPTPSLVPSLLALSDVMATGWHAAVVGRRDARASTAVVVGDGAVGLCGVLAARELGAERIIAMSRHEPRQEIARAVRRHRRRRRARQGGRGGRRGDHRRDRRRRGARVRRHRRRRCARRSPSPGPGSTVGFVGVPHGVELPVRRMFQKNVGLAGGMAPVRKLPARAAGAASLAARSTPGWSST